MTDLTWKALKDGSMFWGKNNWQRHNCTNITFLLTKWIKNCMTQVLFTKYQVIPTILDARNYTQQIAVPLRVLPGYFAATACMVAIQPFVTGASKYLHSTLNGTA